jgi:hypothetical protein
MDAGNDAVAPPAEWLARVRALEGRGELLAAYDVAQQGLAAHPEDLPLKHRAVLVLAKSGATLRAREELERLGLVGHAEADVAALEARLAKDAALAAPPEQRRDLLVRAADLYARIYRRGGGYYPGINVATLRLLAGDTSMAEQVAAEILQLCDAAQDDAFYVAATRAEALLVLGRAAEAQAALEAAAASSNDLAARATTRRQLRLVVAARHIDDAVLAPLASPTVITYTGHMIAPSGAAGRFAATSEAQVARDIAAALERHGVGFGYGPLASGSDILFAEALLARGAELHVVLPFDRDEFKQMSVAPAGAAWLTRFDACFARATSVTFATDDRYLGHDHLFTYGSYVAMGLAVLRARYIDAPVRQIAVWDGAPAAGLAGTAIDVALWRARGGVADVIPCGPSTGATVPTTGNRAPANPRQLRAMLFGDVKGFSKLQEAQIPPFVEHVLGAFGRTLARYKASVLYANTWGDGLFVVLDEAVAAAECALDLQLAMDAIDLAAVGLPETLALRLGGHFGPVFEAEDPVQHVTNFFGAHVSRTARIEPVTPPAEVYITEPFAARLALGPGNFASDYVGQVPAAKGYGTLRMYHLRRS